MTSSGTQEIFVASDIGGTFTDTVVLDGTQQLSRYKSPTTPDDLVRGVLDTFALAAEERGISPRDFIDRIRLFSHGTTVATNTLLERSGARTGAIHTLGFGGTLFIAKGYKRFGADEATLKDFRHLTKHLPVVNRRLVREVPERVDYSGRVLMPLDEDATREAVRSLVEAGAEAIAVSLLWCTKHPDHERRVAEIVREEAPDVYVSTSSEVLARVNEYSRGITTAINAYLGPRVSRVTASLRATLSEAGLKTEPLLMQSNGGVTFASQAAARPVNFLLSGPVGGVVGCGIVARAIGEKNVVTTDMGGTSFDVGLIVDGQPLLEKTMVLDSNPIGVPTVGVQAVGAGGGSIAKVDGGELHVGPASAGAVPGPACYGGGGTEATVTDADVVLGLINPTTFLGGRKKLDRDAAVQAIRVNVAEPLDLSVEEAAAGIKRIVDSKMTDLIRQATIHRGYDPREFALVAFGGAGPVHAYSYAAGLGVKRLVVPRTASVHSAYGVLSSDLVVTTELSQSFLTPAGATGASRYIDAQEPETLLVELEGQARAVLQEQGLADESIQIDRLVDMRFRFQIHELTMPVPGELTPESLDLLVDRFIETYEARMGEGSAFSAAGVEFVTWRIVATGVVDRPTPATEPQGNANASTPIRTDRIYEGEWIEAQVYGEASVSPGAHYTGPAIIEMADTNIVIGPQQTATVDAHGNVVITVEKGTADDND